MSYVQIPWKSDQHFANRNDNHFPSGNPALFYEGSLVYNVCHGLGLFDAVPFSFWPW